MYKIENCLVDGGIQAEGEPTDSGGFVCKTIERSYKSKFWVSNRIHDTRLY